MSTARVDPLRQLRELERDIKSIFSVLTRVRNVRVRTAARMLDMSEREVRENLPIKVYGPKTHRVSLNDIDEFDKRRTLQPK